MPQERAALVEDADGPWSGPAGRYRSTMGAVRWQSACGLLLVSAWLFPMPAYHRGMLRGEASIIINALQWTAYSFASGSH